MIKKKSIIWIATACIVIAGLLDCGIYAYGHLEKPDGSLFGLQTVSAETVEGIIDPRSSLVTASYLYTNTETYEDSAYFYDWRIPFTTTHVNFTYSGTVNTGFDMSALQTVNVDNSKKEIQLKLPDVQIISCEIDQNSYHYNYENYSMFNEFTMDDVTDTLDQLKDKMINKASSDEEFMNTASERGKKIIEDLLQKSDKTKGYTVIWV